VSSLRPLLRRLVPLPARQEVAALLRSGRDGLHPPRWAGRTVPSASHAPFVQLRQPLRAGAYLEGKRANLERAALLIDGSCLGPGETWSFWRCVGRPSRSRGFREGRNLVDGRVVAQVGGGLCQLSGLLHHLGLVAGLQAVERHPHSLDLYAEPERFAPLGSDATVVWGFKDLRLANPRPVPVVLRCRLDGDHLEARAEAASPLHAIDVEFRREPIDPSREAVVTLLDGRPLGRTVYVRLHPRTAP